MENLIKHVINGIVKIVKICCSFKICNCKSECCKSSCMVDNTNDQEKTI